MGAFAKPKLVISKCIEFESRCWNGLMISSDVVKLLKPFAEFTPVCAEMGIGLGVPRSLVRVVSVKGDLRLMQAVTSDSASGAKPGVPVDARNPGGINLFHVCGSAMPRAETRPA
jgi:hypothetical protein